MKLHIRYGKYFPEYDNYFGRPLVLNSSIYEMTNAETFLYEITNRMIYELGFKQFKYQMCVHHKYAQDGSKLVVLSYVHDCVYWYTSEELGKFFVNTFGKIFHVNFLGYSHFFMFIRISQRKDHYISVDQARYATSAVA